tara:strand:- start:1193 stop:1432 length:240 start_codon:yes stop_codon:yes gene_type:complete
VFKKILPMVVMGLGAHEYNKKGMKMKGDLNKDGKMSGYEKKRSDAIQKAVAKKKMGKTKCSHCGGKGCPKCSSGKYKGK